MPDTSSVIDVTTLVRIAPGWLFSGQHCKWDDELQKYICRDDAAAAAILALEGLDDDLIQDRLSVAHGGPVLVNG